MSVCLVATKSIATVALGIYTGMVVTKNLVLAPPAYYLPSGPLGEKKASGKDEEGERTGIFGRFEVISSAMAAVSTTFFGLSYFGAPLHWKHPYLLYCFIGIPLSWIMHTVGTGAVDFALCCPDKAKDTKSGSGSSGDNFLREPSASSVQDYDDGNASLTDDHDDIISEDSIVDLGRSPEGAKSSSSHEEDVRELEAAAASNVAGASASYTSPVPLTSGAKSYPGNLQCSPGFTVARYVAATSSIVIFIANVVGCLGETL